MLAWVLEASSSTVPRSVQFEVELSGSYYFDQFCNFLTAGHSEVRRRRTDRKSGKRGASHLSIWICYIKAVECVHRRLAERVGKVLKIRGSKPTQIYLWWVTKRIGKQMADLPPAHRRDDH